VGSISNLPGPGVPDVRRRATKFMYSSRCMYEEVAPSRRSLIAYVKVACRGGEERAICEFPVSYLVAAEVVEGRNWDE
jgi:hypothetical protein